MSTKGQSASPRGEIGAFGDTFVGSGSLALRLLAAAMTCEIASLLLASPRAAERCYKIRLFQGSRSISDILTLSEACSGNGISLKNQKTGPYFPLSMHMQTATPRSDITTINHKCLIKFACLLPEKFSNIQITSPDYKKKKQLAKTNIPLNSDPICYMNMCFFLKKEDFHAPRAYAAANQCKEIPEK